MCLFKRDKIFCKSHLLEEHINNAQLISSQKSAFELLKKYGIKKALTFVNNKINNTVSTPTDWGSSISYWSSIKSELEKF